MTQGTSSLLAAAGLLATLLGAQTPQWTAPLDISQVPQAATPVATLSDSLNTRHVFFRAVPPGGGSSQLHHVWRRIGRPWSAPVLVSTPGAPLHAASLRHAVGYRFIREDGGGTLHCIFEQAPGLGAILLWHTMLDVRNPGAGWSPPVAISQQATSTFGLAFVIDAQETAHVFYRSIPGAGATQLHHAFRPSGGSWSTPVILSTPGSPASPLVLPPVNQLETPYPLIREDGVGRLHCHFEQVPGAGVSEVWHTELPVANPGGGWTSPVALSAPVGQPASLRDVRIGPAGGLDVIFLAVPGLGAPQLHWTARAPGQAGWAAPVLLSTPGSPFSGAEMARGGLQEDASGRLHLAFEQSQGLGAAQGWHTFLQGNGTWSTPVPFTTTGMQSTVRFLIDSTGTCHALYLAPDIFGAVQLRHSYRRSGQPWVTDTLLSGSGNPPLSASVPVDPDYRFITETPDGRLHVIFEKVPVFPGVQQVLHRELDLAAPGAGWSPVTNVSQASQPATARALVMDRRGTLHLLHRAVPGVGTPQLHASRKPLGGSWTVPELVSTPGSPSEGAALGSGTGYRFLEVDAADTVELVFRQVPGFGAARVWQRRLMGLTLELGPSVFTPGDLVVSLEEVPAGTTEGFTVFSLDTAGPFGGGPWGGLYPDTVSWTLVGLPATPDDVFHWTWPVAPPDYPASDRVWQPWQIPLAPGTTIDAVAAAFSPGGAVISNVFRVTL